MKNPQLPPAPPKFSGNLRHYHRSGTQTQRTWDDWVDGPSARRKSSRNWLKISAVFVSVLALGGIVVGLVIEMG